MVNKNVNQSLNNYRPIKFTSNFNYLCTLFKYKFDSLSTLDGSIKYWIGWCGRFMVFNATFNNISVISWRSVLLVEETGVNLKKPNTCRKLLTNFIT